MTVAALNTESAQHWLQEQMVLIYQQLATGADVSLSRRLHYEGQARLLLQFELVEFDWLKLLTERLYLQYFDEAVNPTLWRWMEIEQTYYLPYRMFTAPVYKK